VVSEPTDLEVVVAHKGLVRWRCHARGRAAHSATPGAGDNAIYKMARAVVAIEKYAREVVGTLGTHPLCGPATLNVGTIAGGVSVNTVPDRCTIEIDRRLAPNEKPDSARQHLIDYLQQKAALGFTLEHDPPYMEGPPLADDHNRPLADRVAKAAMGLAAPCRAVGVPYGTDGAFFAAAGVPTVIFGPGSIAQAHTADEWIALDQVEIAAEIYYRFVKSFC
jgi:acetylornithine deacetylase